jgi:hypothetical protein
MYTAPDATESSKSGKESGGIKQDMEFVITAKNATKSYGTSRKKDKLDQSLAFYKSPKDFKFGCNVIQSKMSGRGITSIMKPVCI